MKVNFNDAVNKIVHSHCMWSCLWHRGSVLLLVI